MPTNGHKVARPVACHKPIARTDADRPKQRNWTATTAQSNPRHKTREAAEWNATGRSLKSRRNTAPPQAESPRLLFIAYGKKSPDLAPFFVPASRRLFILYPPSFRIISVSPRRAAYTRPHKMHAVTPLHDLATHRRNSGSNNQNTAKVRCPEASYFLHRNVTRYITQCTRTTRCFL